MQAPQLPDDVAKDYEPIIVLPKIKPLKRECPLCQKKVTLIIFHTYGYIAVEEDGREHKSCHINVMKLFDAEISAALNVEEVDLKKLKDFLDQKKI